MRRAGILAPVLALAALACGDNSSPNSGPLPDEATLAIGVTAGDDVDASLDALTLPSQFAPLDGAIRKPCANPSVSSATDTDRDGVPDQANFSFTAPPCRFTGIRDATLDLVGQLQIADPAPDEAGFGYTATLVNLRNTFTGKDADHSYSVTRNGSRTLTGDSAGLQLVTDLQVLRTFTGLSDAAVDQRWTVSFSPETPLQINQPLPSGSLDIGGTLDWNRGDQESYRMTVTTPTPIHFDASCDQGRRFDAGELRASGRFGDRKGAIRVRWTGCGQDPQVDFVDNAGR